MRTYHTIFDYINNYNNFSFNCTGLDDFGVRSEQWKEFAFYIIHLLFLTNVNNRTNNFVH